MTAHWGKADLAKMPSECRYRAVAVDCSEEFAWPARDMDDSLPYVQDKIESRSEAVWAFRYSHHQLAAEQAITPVGGLIGKIELRRKHRPIRSLHFDVIVTGTPRIKGRHDGTEPVTTLAIGKDVSAIAEAGIVVFAVLIGMP